MLNWNIENFTVQSVNDTRNDNNLPSWYRSQGSGKYLEFKLTNIIGVNNPAWFALLETYVPINESSGIVTSGGPIHQRAIIWQNTWVRAGFPDDTKWSNWKRMTFE